MTRAWLRPRAEDDLVERAGYYLAQGSGALAERFVDAAFAAFRAAERMPHSGTPSAESAEVPGLRAWRIQGFPVRWYYFVTDHRLDVVRLLADAQDLRSILGDAEPD